MRQYSKARKNKYREYKQSLLKQIESLYDDNPKKYWQLIDELHEKDNKCNEHSSNISPSAWVNQAKGRIYRTDKKSRKQTELFGKRKMFH